MQAVKYSAVNSSVEKHPLLLSTETFILRLSCTRSARLLCLLTESSASLVPALSVRSHSGCRIRPLWRREREKRDTPWRGEQRGEASRRVYFGWNNWTNWRSQRSKLKVLYVIAVCGRAQREYKIKKIKLKGHWWRAGSRESRWRKESKAK